MGLVQVIVSESSSSCSNSLPSQQLVLTGLTMFFSRALPGCGNGQCADPEANAGPGDANYCIKDCCTIDENDTAVKVSDGTPFIGATSLKVTIITDRWPRETSTIIRNKCSGALVAYKPGGSYSYLSTHIDKYCVPESNTFEFTIYDLDGICCGYGNGSVSHGTILCGFLGLFAELFSYS